MLHLNLLIIQILYLLKKYQHTASKDTVYILNNILLTDIELIVLLKTVIYATDYRPYISIFIQTIFLLYAEELYQNSAEYLTL